MSSSISPIINTNCGVLKTPSRLHPELLKALQGLNATAEHFAAAFELAAIQFSVNKFPIQLAKAFRSLGALPSPGVFSATCQLLEVRMRHLPSVGAEELCSTARGYITFLERSPTQELKTVVTHFLQSCSAAGFSIGSVSRVLKHFVEIEKHGVLSIAEIGLVLESVLQNLPTKYPQRLAGLLMRRLALQTMQSSCTFQTSEANAILAAVFGLEFAAVCREVGKAGAGQFGTAARGVLQQIVAADVDMSTGLSGRSYYWGADGYFAMERLANLLADAARSGTVVATEIGVFLSTIPGTLNELASNLKLLDIAVKSESQLRREAIAVESGGTSSTFGSAVSNSPQTISAINNILDLSSGYEAIRNQLSAAFNADLNDPLLSRFGAEAARATIPLYPGTMDKARPAGLIIKGLHNEVFFPSQTGRSSEFDLDVLSAAEYFGRAREICDQAVYFFTAEHFGILLPKDGENRVGDKHFGLVVAARGAGQATVVLMATEKLIEALKHGARFSEVSENNSYVLYRNGNLSSSLSRGDLCRVAALYSDLLGLFKLRLSLWHKGYVPGSIELELRSASTVRMLEECVAIHNIGHGLQVPPELFPQLVLRPTFEYRAALPSPFVVDTRTLTMQVDGKSFALRTYRGGPDSNAFVLWHKFVVPYLYNVGSDICFVRDRLRT